ncbi:hypothetical protein SAMN05216328_1245 [Ensifer sp. YR511]|nr:hypothetical protein SAMN05216328_1245 [Ensifer sp. YR511]
MNVHGRLMRMLDVTFGIIAFRLHNQEYCVRIASNKICGWGRVMPLPRSSYSTCVEHAMRPETKVSASIIHKERDVAEWQRL